MRPKRPTYDIPQVVKNNLEMAKNRLNGRMAGAAQAEQNILRSMATANRGARMFGNSQQALASVGQTQLGANQAFNQLSVAEQQDRLQREATLNAANSQMAEYQDKAFSYNQDQPFQNQAATKAALLGGGISNLMGAVNTASNVAGQYMGLQARYPDLFGGSAAAKGKSFNWNPLRRQIARNPLEGAVGGQPMLNIEDVRNIG